MFASDTHRILKSQTDGGMKVAWKLSGHSSLNLLIEWSCLVPNLKNSTTGRWLLPGQEREGFLPKRGLSKRQLHEYPGKQAARTSKRWFWRLQPPEQLSPTRSSFCRGQCLADAWEFPGAYWELLAPWCCLCLQPTDSFPQEFDGPDVEIQPLLGSCP